MRKRKYKTIDQIDMTTVELGQKCTKIIGKAQVTLIWGECKYCNRRRWVRLKYDKPITDSCLPCSKKYKKISGPANPNWKGGRLIRPDGYVDVYVEPDNEFHQMAKGKRNKYVFEHRLVMAAKLKRPLEPWEIVHHVDGDRSNNNPDNLLLFPQSGHHWSITRLEQEIEALKKQLKNLKKGKENDMSKMQRKNATKTRVYPNRL